MPESKGGKRQHDGVDEREDAARQSRESQDKAGEVRQDEALTSAERLPRRGDHEIPPGKDSSV